MTSTQKKKFLFLQGPHGPFQYQLASLLRDAGASIFKIGFNHGDEFFWRDDKNYTAYRGKKENWNQFIREYFGKNAISDIVVYGDVRPMHLAAIEIARELEITVHCFEEGYLRPYWATYERGGVNGHSRLMGMSVEDMRIVLDTHKVDLVEAPANWGDVRQHALLGAVYHWHIMFRNKGYPHYKQHRETTVRQEFRLHVRRLLTVSVRAIRRWRATRAIKSGGFAYHLALLQLGHDTSIQTHSPFSSMEEFIRVIITTFARAPHTHHHLVFKSHPLEDFRFPLDKITRAIAKEHGVEDRVHFVLGGKLAEMLDSAKSVVTVNSTAAQQALWRGLPVKCFGESVYNKPDLVSMQPLDEFFKEPKIPDIQSYWVYRQYLLATSQISGGFYSQKSRTRLLRKVVDLMLADQDPYELLAAPRAKKKQSLRIVS